MERLKPTARAKPWDDNKVAAMESTSFVWAPK
jgi:hypothetical protein